MTSAAPRADRHAFERTHHGDTFVDHYEWLRDGEAPEVQAYLNAENEFTDRVTADLAEARETFFNDIVARTKQTDLSVASWITHFTPEPRPYWYYSRTVEGQEYRIHARVPAADRDTPPDPEIGIPADEEVFFDGNAEAAGHDFFSLGDCDPSPDGTRLAYSVDTEGNERYTLRFRTMSGDHAWPEVIADTAGGIAWAGNDVVFYTVTDEAWRPHRVLRHVIGTDPAEDVVVFTEPDDKFWVSVGNSRDGDWVVIDSSSKISSEVHLVPTAEPEAEPHLVAPRRHGIEYSVEPAGDRLLIVHNDRAVDFALAEAPLDATGPEQWRELIAERRGVRLLDVAAHRGHAVLSLRTDGLSAIRVLPRTEAGDLDLTDHDGYPGRAIEVDEPIRVLSAVEEHDYDSDRVRFHHMSLITPPRISEVDLISGTTSVLRETPVLDHPEHGPYRPEDYVQERLWATAADGTRIPISLVRRADTPPGPAPLVLYGYGAYEIPMEPTFLTWRISLLDQGITWAIAHIRGGGELGRSWYEDGKFAAKPNTFSDFVDCARFLVDSGYTTPDRLGAIGGSAGGLLMGAVANLAPDLFRAILAPVPFVDPLTSILDPSLPLTVIEWDEWGNPLEDPEIYAVMKSYTPYENLRPVRYPAILAATSFHDTRVLFVEPAKWVAALRHTATNPDEEILLRVEMSAGHGGVSGRYQAWRQMAFEMTWLIDRITGDDPESPAGTIQG
ncbi:S9 family peptidase [Enemella sp. A6]|uniref:S9 family peptidase n=1 Tax=Enemella sp. A6 TaxID=3440152 RepID=UPI003EB9AE42